MRLAATIALAHLSYQYVETPIRRGALGRSWKALREAQGFRRWELGVRWAGAVVPVMVLCAALGVAAAHAKSPEPPSYLSSMKPIHTKVTDGAREPTAAAAPSVGRDSATQATLAAAREDEQRTRAKKEKKATAAETRAPAGPVTAIGDSVLLGSVSELQGSIDNLTVVPTG